MSGNSQRRDGQAEFSTLVDRHRGILRKVVNTYCPRVHEQEDLRQEILVQLWRAWPRYDRSRTFSTWMYRIALNVAISHVRLVYRTQQTVVASEPDYEPSIETESELELRNARGALHQAMAAFDPLNRALLLLHLDGLGNREIAEILGLAESNVGTKLSRIRQTLKERFA